MPQKFVFLVITDPEISGFINAIRKILDEKEHSTSVHLTVRGPYDEKDKISEEDVKKWNSLLDAEPLLISGTGRFTNRDKEVVYLKVAHKNLEKIWWKPDYPSEKFGINPHITLYEGNDQQFANLVVEFIRGEKLALLCHKFRLATHALKQNDLFEIPDNAYRPPLELLNRRVISLTFLERLNRLVSNYKKAMSKKS